MDELLGWSEKKFTTFHLAFLRRETVAAMEARKLAMISGLYGNSNLDGEGSPRAKMITEIDAQFAEAIANLYDPPTEKEDDPLDTPFFKAMAVSGDLTAKEVESYEKTKRGMPWIPTDLEEDL